WGLGRWNCSVRVGRRPAIAPLPYTTRFRSVNIPLLRWPWRSVSVMPESRLSSSPLPGALPEYTLTRICSVEYIKRVESVFEIIAEPNRRAILSLLVWSQQSVGEIERQLRMPQP